MSKYFSYKETKNNSKYDLRFLIAFLYDLKGFEVEDTNTKEYKSLISKCAALNHKKTEPLFIDLSQFIDEKGWKQDKTSMEVIKELNQDISDLSREISTGKSL